MIVDFFNPRVLPTTNDLPDFDKRGFFAFILMTRYLPWNFIVFLLLLKNKELSARSFLFLIFRAFGESKPALIGTSARFLLAEDGQPVLKKDAQAATNFPDIAVPCEAV
jgi:hypothetical protein